MADYVYTSFYQLNLDLSLYVAISNSETLNLSMFPSLAASRWTWITKNWTALYPRFKTFAGGNEYLEANLVDFDTSVKSALIGNKANVMEIPEKFNAYSDFLALLTINELDLSNQETTVVDIRLQEVANFGISRFRAMLQYLKRESVLTAQYVGLADETSARIRGISLSSKKRSATFSDLASMEAGIELERFIEGIIVQLKSDKITPPNLLINAQNNIDPVSDVNINTAYVSYTSVIFQGSLQKMAQKYLGSPDRWFELVTVNNLKAPFIDENGTKVFLLSSGSGSSLYIGNNYKDSISVSSKVRIGSYTQKEEIRIIERISDNKDGTLTIFVNGEKDLSKLNIADVPYMKIFKPGTVNTGSFILIPSDVRSQARSVPTPKSDELRQLGADLLSFGVDIQRDEKTNDFIVDQTGNFKMSYGLANIRQAVLTSLRTEQGELPYQPQIGIPASIGTEYYGSFSEAQVLSDLISASVKADTRFRSVVVSNLQNGGNSISLDLIAYIRDSDTAIPLSFVG
jgi:hypothetical protein